MKIYYSVVLKNGKKLAVSRTNEPIGLPDLWTGLINEGQSTVINFDHHHSILSSEIASVKVIGDETEWRYYCNPAARAARARKKAEENNKLKEEN
jgi:hypothetical protein